MFNKGCGPCQATGYYGINISDKCLVCDGSGQITLEDAQLDYRVCGSCCGSGYVGFNVRRTCRTCKGSGLIRPAKDGNLAIAASD